MNLQLTEEQELVIAMVRRFVREEILPLELALTPMLKSWRLRTTPD